MNNWSVKNYILLFRENGATLVLVAGMMTLLAGLIAFSLDVGYLYSTRNELQNVADAAALAGAREVGVIYEAEPDKSDFSDSEERIINASKITGAKNFAGGMNIQVDNVEIGHWKNGSFDPGNWSVKPDAVRATVARKEGGINGALTTFFGPLLGKNFFNVSTHAVAALTPESTIDPGEMELPVGIPTGWFDYHRGDGDDFCGDQIQFYPSGDYETGCAGWHVFDEPTRGASTIRRIIDGINPDIPDITYESPAVDTNESPSFLFNGGVAASAWDNLVDLYDAKKDPDTGKWETTVVVYDESSCENPNQSREIVGFASVIITRVTSSPLPNEIVGEIQCNKVEFGRGSGGEYGTKGSIPGLVE